MAAAALYPPDRLFRLAAVIPAGPPSNSRNTPISAAPFSRLVSESLTPKEETLTPMDTRRAAREDRKLIAVPSDDHVTIAAHFGRAGGFIIYSTNGEIEEVGYRKTLHDQKDHCGCASAERPSRHESVLDALDECRVVIARGMGVQMYDDLHACGIEVVLTDCALADRAVEEFVAGSLSPRSSFECDREPGGYVPTDKAVPRHSRGMA